MKKSLIHGLLVAGFFFVSAACAQTLFNETFEDGSRTDGSPVTWVQGSTTASNLEIVSDATLGSNALKITSASGIVATDLPTSYSLSTSTTLVLSFDFRFTQYRELRIGLFNSMGTVIGSTDGSLATSNDQGVYVHIATPAPFNSQSKVQVLGEAGGVSNIFGSTDRIYGADNYFALLGTTAHHADVQYLLSGTNVEVKVYIDGALIATQNVAYNGTNSLSTFVGAGGVNQIAMVASGDTGSGGDILVDNITLTMIPEPKTSFLLFGFAGLMTIILSAVRFSKELPRRFFAAE